jgi:hypothetical protein
MAIRQAYAMYLSVMHGALVFFAPGSDFRVGVSTDFVFAQLKLAISNFLRGNDCSKCKRAEEAPATPGTTAAPGRKSRTSKRPAAPA